MKAIIFGSVVGVLALILSSGVEASSESRGSLAKGPFSNSAVQILTVKNGSLGLSDGNTIIEKSLRTLQRQYGVRISQKALAGYILDLDQAETEAQYEGFDLDAHVDEPRFAPWFHNPFPEIPESAAYTESLWKYATTGQRENGYEPGKITYAVAYTHFDHVFFPLKKFATGFYYNPVTTAATDEGFESVLHEALHIWHFRNRASVDHLLKSKGSYFDRVALSETVCPKFLEVSSRFDEQQPCGHSSKEAAMKAVLAKAKWPQRYGSLTQRLKARVKGSYGCSSQGGETTINGQVVCLSESESGLVGDLHALDNEAEYFAILMQLYIFSPDDFRRVATGEEADFAKSLFGNDFK